MTKSEIEKVVDELIVRLPIGKAFPLKYELSVYFVSINSKIDLETDKTLIFVDVQDLMVESEYIKYQPLMHTTILEPKGIEAKKAGGHFKYLESLKPKKEYWLTKYQIISISLVIIFGFFGVYKYFDNKELKSEHKTLKSEHKTLKSEHKTLKSDFETLKSKYDSVIKQKEELQKRILNDSL